MNPTKLLIGLVLVGAVTLLAASLAQAQAAISGEVVVIDGLTNEITIQTDEGELITVIPPDDYDLSELTIGDSISLDGDFAGDVFVAEEIEITELDEDDEDDVDFDSDKGGYYCENRDDPHPALNRLAQAYDWDYADLIEWFCEGRFGVGEVKHALSTSEQLGGDPSPEEILQMKRDLGGWGRVWQELGLKGGRNGNGNGGGNGDG
jgi:hypothetical protein